MVSYDQYNYRQTSAPIIRILEAFFNFYNN